jgi:hypothetical protein
MAEDPNGKVNNDSVFVILAVAAVAIVIVIYFNFHVIANTWRWVRFGELYLLQWIPAFNFPFLGTVDFGKSIIFLSSVSEYGITLRQITVFDNIYAPFFGVPAALYLIFKGLTLNHVNPELNKIFDMESAFAHFVPIYPHLKEIFDAHPENKSIHYNRNIEDSYRWGKMVNPLPFATMSPPLLLEEEAKKNASFNKAILEGGLFDEDLAERAFQKQMGDYWQGESKLSEHELITFHYIRGQLPVDNSRVEPFVSKVWNALVRVSAKKPRTDCPVIKRFSDEENILLKSYWSAYEKDFKKIARITKVNESERIAIIKKLKRDDIVLSLCSDKSNRFKKDYQRIRAANIMGSHAYVRTGLMQMNEDACKGGRISLEPIKGKVKLASRELWFGLKASGRRTSFPESAGIFAHWLLEQDLGRPVSAPCVQEAVEALRLSLKIEEE